MADSCDFGKLLNTKDSMMYYIPGQILCRQCVTEYEKLTKPPENENITEIIETESSQDKLASDDDF